MKSASSSILRTTAILVLSAFAATAYSQVVRKSEAIPTEPVPTKPAATAVPEDSELIVLSPFEITANTDKGYQATETLAGTRIRTDLRDVGSAITVVTKEYLRDIGATDNATLIQYTPSAEVGGTRTTYGGFGNGTDVSEWSSLGSPNANTRVRGLSAADNTRDFFVTDIPTDFYIVDRVDIQRGPNSILFGLGKPAGIINSGLRGAEFQNKGEIQSRVGSWGTFRNSFDVNQQLIDKTLAIRVNGLSNHEKFRQTPAYSNDERVYGAIRFDPKLLGEGFNTSLRAKFEHGRISANRPRTVTPNDNITPWFRSSSSPWGGLNKQTFDPYDVENQQSIANDGKGQARAADPEYNPWVGASGNQQQPVYFIDGSTGRTYQIYGGYNIYQARSSTGTRDGTITAIPYSDMFLSVASLPTYATNKKLPGYEFGQYRTQTLTDPTIFDFHNNLIDGSNKHEGSKWDAYNISLSQTGWGDRFGAELIYDHQSFYRDQKALFENPGINVDLLTRFQDFSANPNVGRAYINGGAGKGLSYDSKRENLRASFFGELRSTDFLEKGSLLARLLGKHRFNGVMAYENYKSKNRQWLLYANASTFDIFSQGSLQGFVDRPPQTIVYLGGSLAGLDSASGANIPRVMSQINLNDGALYAFSGQWNASTVNPGDAWNRTGDAVWGQFAEGSGTTQSENPANYVGWNRNFALDILRADDDAALLTTTANNSKRTTKSYAGSWQSYWWDGAFVGTLGWRYDIVNTKEDQGKKNAANRSYIDSMVRMNRVPIKDHSLSWGGVFHLNKLLRRDPLPINVSVSYNRSSNFEVTGARTGLYGSEIAAPTGKTKDIGLRLSTKDNKYSFRITKYEAEAKDVTSSSFNSAYLGGVLARGLAWTNVFQYNLGGYTIDTANTGASGRYTYSPASGETQAQADAREAAAISAWRELQGKVDPRIFSTWGFDPSQIYNYVTAVTQPASFSITEDTKSKGYEYELTANPLPNWRISANASQNEATRNNIGGAEVKSYIALIDYYMNSTAAGDLRVFYGNAEATTMKIQWNANFSGQWALKKLQEGSAVPEIRKWRYNVTSNYDFTKGFLKGVGIGASYRWEDKVVIGYPVVAKNSTEYTFDLSRPYYGPSEDAVDCWINYQRKLTPKLGWKIQLNVRNALTKDGVIPISVQPDGQTWAAVRSKPDRELFVTNSLTF